MLADPQLLFRPTSPGRRFKARLVVVLTVLAFALAMVPLLAIGAYIVSQGIGVIRPEFFVQDPPGDLSQLGGGIRNAIVGTLQMTGVATPDRPADGPPHRGLQFGGRRAPCPRHALRARRARGTALDRRRDLRLRVRGRRPGPLLGARRIGRAGRDHAPDHRHLDRGDAPADAPARGGGSPGARA